MTRREELQEQYEDALFALWMNEVAEAEGEELLKLNEQLKADPDAAMPDEVLQACLKTIRRSTRREKAAKFGRQAFKGLTYAAAVFGVICTTTISAFAVSSDFRSSVLNLLVTQYGDHIDFRVNGSSQSPSATVNVNWVPDGYTLQDHSVDSFGSNFRYENQAGGYFIVICESSAGAGVGLDSEDTEYQIVTVNGAEGHLLQKDNEIQLFWLDTEQPLFFSIIAESLSAEDVLQIAAHLTYDI